MKVEGVVYSDEFLEDVLFYVYTCILDKVVCIQLCVGSTFFLQCVVDCICTGHSCESLVLSVMSVHFVDSCHV